MAIVNVPVASKTALIKNNAAINVIESKIVRVFMTSSGVFLLISKRMEPQNMTI